MAVISVARYLAIAAFKQPEASAEKILPTSNWHL